MRVLIFGGRKYGNVEMFEMGTAEKAQAAGEERHVLSVLTQLRSSWECRNDEIVVISGMAKGVDTIAVKWAQLTHNHFKVERFYADWKTHKKAAGPIRNKKMIDEGKPDLAIEFPGGKGTADMDRRCRAAGIELMCIAPF